MGERVNIGCGVITANYDGFRKHRTVIDDEAFIGSNVNLIAPVSVGKGAFIVAGSTITENVGDDGVAIGAGAGVQFAEAAFYEYPKSFIGAWGRGLRLFSPDSLLGSTFKLKEKDSGYWEGWHGLGTPEIRPTLEPGS